LKKFIHILILAVLVISCKEETPKADIASIAIAPKPKPVYEYGFNLNNYKVINDTIKNGESFGTILDRHHVLYPKIYNIAATVKDSFDVRRVRAGQPYTILASKDSTEQAKIFIYKKSKALATVVNFQDSIIKAYTFKKPIKVIEKEASGIIYNSLSHTMDSLHLKPSLVYTIADNIYAWTLDFERLHKGDHFKIIFEEKYINDTVFVGYGKVKAAVFNHRGRNLYAFRYAEDGHKKNYQYYTEEGNMMKRLFLKSPIKFQYRISSRYNLRRRIKLYGNKVRPHRGTDFAAKYGTPIISTASGTVIESTLRGGNGNYVKIRHNNTYMTQYLHMSKRLVKKGDYVTQGQIIGRVGMTGNTSGPHVCYRFWKNGRQVDPLRQKLPSAKPLPKDKKPAYLEYIKPLRNRLDQITISPNNKKDLDNLVVQN